MGHAVRVRAMHGFDAPEVMAIYAEGLATGTASFETTVPPWTRWDAGHLVTPRLVAVDASPNTSPERLLGWAALSPVSDRCAYAGVAEVSVYVAADARGRGLGRRLLHDLASAAEQAGLWTLQAGIFTDNHASIAAHRAAGFRVVGTRERLGRLAGTWRDVLLLERRSTTTGT